MTPLADLVITLWRVAGRGHQAGGRSASPGVLAPSRLRRRQSTYQCHGAPPPGPPHEKAPAKRCSWSGVTPPQAPLP